jgi:hypothetical protein
LIFLKVEETRSFFFFVLHVCVLDVLDDLGVLGVLVIFGGLGVLAW